MPEIRRIRQDEAEAVVALWNEAGPLQERGRRNIEAMLVLAASSHRAACLVALEDGEIRGFAMAELMDDGLLPCLYGRVADLFARRDEGLERGLAAAAVTWLRERGAVVIQADVPLDEPRAELWAALGFEAEAVRWAAYTPHQPTWGGA